MYQTTFALFGARRFAFDATHTGYLLAAFGFLGVLVQVGLVGVGSLKAKNVLGEDPDDVGELLEPRGAGGALQRVIGNGPAGRFEAIGCGHLRRLSFESAPTRG